MEVIHVVMTPYGTSKPGLPTTICINVFERQRRKRRGDCDLELSRNPAFRVSVCFSWEIYFPQFN